MSIFLTGVSCVGKTTVGAKLAALLGCPFFDLDHELESFFSMPIERLQDKFLTMYALPTPFLPYRTIRFSRLSPAIFLLSCAQTVRASMRLVSHRNMCNFMS